MKTAFLFPGQGAQSVGMGKDICHDFPEADSIFDQASDLLSYDMKSLCFDGSVEKLNSTTFSQPAIFTMSAAILEVIKTNKPALTADISAGLSMGEYSALYSAGLLNFADGLCLVQKRGQAMQAAADATEGTMVSIIGLDAEKTQKLCQQAGQGQILSAVNFNCPGQIVISGEKAPCQRAAELAESFGAIKAIPLAVAGAFHTSLMDSAASDLAKALDDCDIKNPDSVKVIANISAEYYNDSSDIKTSLVQQLTSPLLWQTCMERLLDDGLAKFYELGPSRVLTGLMRRIDRKIRVTNLSSSKSLQTLFAD